MWSLTEQMLSNMESFFQVDIGKLWWICFSAFSATSYSPQLKASHNNKMASCFAVVSYENIISIKEAAVMKNTKTATKCALIALNG